MKRLQNWKVFVFGLVCCGGAFPSVAALAPDQTDSAHATEATAEVARPTRLKFNAYEGDPKEPNNMTFQINELDLKKPSRFLKVGEVIPQTHLRIEKFTFKENVDPKTGAKAEVSELTVGDSDTQKTIVLVLGKVTDIP
jgi:hypothetical protein